MLAVHCSLLYYGYILVLALLLLFMYPLLLNMKFYIQKKKEKKSGSTSVIPANNIILGRSTINSDCSIKTFNILYRRKCYTKQTAAIIKNKKKVLHWSIFFSHLHAAVLLSSYGAYAVIETRKNTINAGKGLLLQLQNM